MTTRTSSGPGSGSGSDGSAAIALFRPLNAALAAAAVLVGAVAAARPVDWSAAALGAGSAVAASCAANALNDAVDVMSDTVNRPRRPVVSGRVSPRAAVWSGIALFAASAVLAAPLGGHALALVAAWALLTTLYSLALKGVPVVGNLIVAAVAASPLLMGGLTQGLTTAVRTAGRSAAHAMQGVEPDLAIRRLVVMFLLAALVHLARELVKDAEDAAGDSLARKRTLAVAFGPAAALAGSRVVIVVVMWAAVAPYALGLLGTGYLGVLVPLEATLAWLVVHSSSGGAPDAARLRQLSNGLKVVMVLGLVAFVAGIYS